MNDIKDLSKTIILCDFDGTITTFDTNDMFTDIYGDKDYNDKITRLLTNGELGGKEAARLYLDQFDMDEKIYLDFMLNEVVLQEGFVEFYENVKRYDVNFAILSGGYINGISSFLKKHGIEDIKIYANELVFNDGKISINFYDEYYLDTPKSEESDIDFKVKICRLYKEKYDKIIFIGDGFTDRYIIDEVDFLFAKDYLEKHCIENNVDYIKWKDFKDINKILFGVEE